MKNSGITKIILSTVFIVFMSGCSSSGKWSCPLPESGKACRSISDSDNGIESSLLSKDKKKKKNEKINKNMLSDTVTGIKMDDLNPVRTKEVIGRILVTPYIDREGNLNSGKYIYTIDAKPKWKIN